MSSAVMTWAIKKRLEKEREHTKDDMDIGNVDGRAGKLDPELGGGPYGGYWPDDAGWMQGHVNYMKRGGEAYGKYGRGKGGGKFEGAKGGKHG